MIWIFGINTTYGEQRKDYARALHYRSKDEDISSTKQDAAMHEFKRHIDAMLHAGVEPQAIADAIIAYGKTKEFFLQVCSAQHQGFKYNPEDIPRV